MYEIAQKTEYRKPDIFYKVTIAFRKSRPNRTERSKFSKELEDINRENVIWTGQSRLGNLFKNLYTHICEVCRFMNRKLIKFENVVKDMKDNSKEKWYCKYEKIARDYFKEDLNCLIEKPEMLYK
jgi:hypothetical protein